MIAEECHTEQTFLPAVITSILESSNLGGNVMQSTVLDGHCICPDFDVSVIKGVVLMYIWGNTILSVKLLV